MTKPRRRDAGVFRDVYDVAVHACVTGGLEHRGRSLQHVLPALPQPKAAMPLPRLLAVSLAAGLLACTTAQAHDFYRLAAAWPSTSDISGTYLRLRHG
jgi:hypothetical protein